jgi:hypothetical protein
MTAHICFKFGKYLSEPEYKSGIIRLMEVIPDIEVINLTLLFSDNLGMKKDGLSITEATTAIMDACKKVDEMPDEAKRFILDQYLEANPEEAPME